MKLSPSAGWLVLAFSLVGCGASSAETSASTEIESQSAPLLLPTQCLRTTLCLKGSHFNSDPKVCGCVPDVCTERMLCVQGTHFDSDPKVCGCVPNVCLDRVLCVQGTHFDSDPKVCGCVANFPPN